MSEPGLSIVGGIMPGFPASTGYGTRAYGNTKPSVPMARWLLVRPDGRVTAYAGKVEYGQNIRTGLAVEVADELRLPLADVEVVLGDTDQTPWDMGTFGSQSTAKVGLFSCPFAHQKAIRRRGAVSPRSASPIGPAPTRLPRMALPPATKGALLALVPAGAV